MGKPAVKTTAPKKKSIKKQPSKATAKKKIDNNSYKKKKAKTFFRQDEFKRSIGNVKEGHGFAVIKKKKFLASFKRKTKRNKKNQDTINISSSNEEIWSNTPVRPNTLKISQEHSPGKNMNAPRSRTFHSSLSRKLKTKTNFDQIQVDYKAIQKEREQKAEELQARLAERETDLLRKIQKRRNITKRLMRRTSRGQPVMSERLGQILNKLKNP